MIVSDSVPLKFYAGEKNRKLQLRRAFPKLLLMTRMSASDALWIFAAMCGVKLIFAMHVVDPCDKPVRKCA